MECNVNMSYEHKYKVTDITDSTYSDSNSTEQRCDDISRIETVYSKSIQLFRGRHEDLEVENSRHD